MDDERELEEKIKELRREHSDTLALNLEEYIDAISDVDWIVSNILEEELGNEKAIKEELLELLSY